jgi:hypothetical protein
MIIITIIIQKAIETSDPIIPNPAGTKTAIRISITTTAINKFVLAPMSTII